MRNFAIFCIAFILTFTELAFGKIPKASSKDFASTLNERDSIFAYSSEGRDLFEIKTSTGELIRVLDVNGLAYLGDMILGRTEDLKAHGLNVSLDGESLQSDDLINPHGAIIYPNSGGVWPNGIVPYTYASNLSSQSRRDMEYAVNHWNTRTSLRFVPRTNERDYLVIQDGGGCSSWIGKRGGRQAVNLASGCGKGAAVHELGHAIGMFHEQTRIDRDNFVTIIRNNIRPDMIYNFEKMTTRDGTTDGSYDFRSIMHYRSDAFSTNGRDTIVPKVSGVDIGYMGRGSVLSAGDLKAVASLYGEGGEPPPPPAEGQLSMSKPLYKDGEGPVVNFRNCSANPYDWIGIFRQGASNEDHLTWQYLDGETTGARRFESLSSGRYEARLFFNDTYNVEARASFSVESNDEANPQVLSRKTSYAANEEIVIEFSNAGGNEYDWIGLYQENANNRSYLTWQFLRGRANGRLRFSGLPPGNYSARLFFNDSYQLEADTNFRVSN